MDTYVIVILIVSAIVLLAGSAAKIYCNAKKEYKCPLCNRTFRPKINNWMRLLLNFPQGGCALKCPFCKEKHIMKEYD